jgi:hypothetical protein
MDWTTGLTIAVSVLLALGGYLATYTYNLKLAQRKDRLDRVNQQLSELYGPLLALASASGACWIAFRQRYRPSALSFWDSDPTPTTHEAAAWRIWMTEVFMPLNERIADVITQRAHLLDESDMPESLLTACAHVNAYRPVIKQWEAGDFSEHISGINFPSLEVLHFASEGFRKCKAEQAQLLARRRQ